MQLVNYNDGLCYIEFRSTKAYANANGLSRLLSPIEDDSESMSEVSVLNMSQINKISVSVVDLCKATHSDPILSKVFYHLHIMRPRELNTMLDPSK